MKLKYIFLYDCITAFLLVVLFTLFIKQFSSQWFIFAVTSSLVLSISRYLIWLKILQAKFSNKNFLLCTFFSFLLYPITFYLIYKLTYLSFYSFLVPFLFHFNIQSNFLIALILFVIIFFSGFPVFYLLNLSHKYFFFFIKKRKISLIPRIRLIFKLSLIFSMLFLILSPFYSLTYCLEIEGFIYIFFFSVYKYYVKRVLFV
jgi:hypothetical protein